MIGWLIGDLIYLGLKSLHPWILVLFEIWFTLGWSQSIHLFLFYLRFNLPWAEVSQSMDSCSIWDLIYLGLKSLHPWILVLFDKNSMLFHVLSPVGGRLVQSEAGISKISLRVKVIVLSDLSVFKIFWERFNFISEAHEYQVVELQPNNSDNMKQFVAADGLTCLLCNLKCHNTSNLRRHLVTHSGEKKFPCMHCGKRFARRHTLHDHMRRLHGITLC